MKKAIVLYVILVLILMSFNTTAFSFEDLFKTNNFLQPKQVSTCGGEGIGMANPAAVYCTELGYDYKIITEEDGGQHGICVFNKRNQCGGWEFLQGKCGQKYNYCAKEGYKTKIKTDGKDEFTQEYAVCVNRFGREIGTVTKLTNLNDKSVKSSREMPLLEEIKKDNIPVKSSRTLPANFDWRDYNGEDWMTPVKDQGICGSCYAFSAIGMTEAEYNVRSGNPNLDLNLSEEQLVSDCRTVENSGCCGGSLPHAIDFIKDFGVVDEECMFYVDGTGCGCSGGTCDSICEHNSTGVCSDTSCSEDLCLDWETRLISFDSKEFIYQPIMGEIKQIIMEKGPVSSELDMSSGSLGEDNVLTCTNPSDWDHAIIIIGWDDADQTWIVKNSYGDDYGTDGGYFKVGYGECKLATFGIWSIESDDTDEDGIWDLYDNCDYTYNPAQGDIDGDEIGDACDTTDSAYQQFFFGDYYDTNGTNYDNEMGGGPCNQAEGCDYADNETDFAYCNGSYWPNYCVYEGTCYKGDGTQMIDIDGPLGEKHEARCIGFGWWDLDTGLPGINTCEEAGYIWTNNVSEPRFEVGEFIYSAPNNFGCCGDDENEYWDGLTCYESEAAANRKEKPILKSIPAYAFNLGFLFPFFKKKPL